MSERLIARMLAPLKRAIANMAARGTVVLADSASKMQTLQIKLLADEAKADIEHFEPYGMTACPKEGAEHVTLFFGGDRSHGVTLLVADRRYRLKGLQPGEVALYDDLGQKVHLTRNGIVVDGGGLPVTIQNTPHVTADTPTFTMTGDLDVQGGVTVGADVAAVGDVTAGAISLKNHTHGGVTPGGSNTGAPQ